MIADLRSTGHRPVINLSKNAKNTELVPEVRLPSLHKSFLASSGTLAVGCLAVLEAWLSSRCCLPLRRVSTVLSDDPPEYIDVGLL